MTYKEAQKEAKRVGHGVCEGEASLSDSAFLLAKQWCLRPEALFDWLKKHNAPVGNIDIMREMSTNGEWLWDYFIPDLPYKSPAVK